MSNLTPLLHGGIASIYVSNMDRAVLFYTETLGFRLAMRIENEWAELDAGNGFVVGLHPANSLGASPGTIGAISIELRVAAPHSLDDVVAALQNRGVAFTGPIASYEHVRLASLKDPDGNLIILGQTVEKQVEALNLGFEVDRPTNYYEGYVGYDKDFLGFPVPLPTLTPEQLRDAAKNNINPSGIDAWVLPYTHFSLVMARSRQLALYTAVNIDGAHTEDKTRESDKWYYDSRIAESEQIGEFLYKKNNLDRGHLVRRLDPVWGPDAAKGNDDTFHFTNCSPQHAKFNQGKDLWQGLENYILNNAASRKRRVTVFTGPVLDAKDPLYKGVRLPLAFWKIIVYQKNDGSLATAAYMLEQAELVKNDFSGLEIAFEAGPFRVEISHIIERTGIDFSYLANNELPLSSDGLELQFDTGRVRIRENYTNIVL
ncbi:MAG: endonuclease [Hymenobacter sp.]|nr:endonuclease [Hymenobacter sp.]